jgi:hypothetical protein
MSCFNRYPALTELNAKGNNGLLCSRLEFPIGDTTEEEQEWMASYFSQELA